MASNQTWEKEELILALELYFREGGSLSRQHPEVLELCEVLRALPLRMDLDEGESVRSIGAITAKLANFIHIDAKNPLDGLPGTGARDREVFAEFVDDRDSLFRLANGLRSGVAEGTLPDVLSGDDDAAPEGRLITKTHVQRERNPAIARKRKRQFREKHGELKCEICSFSESDMREKYGELKSDFFECHHRRPLQEVFVVVQTAPSDLAILCPDCHRAIHRMERLPLVEDAASLIESRRGSRIH